MPKEDSADRKERILRYVAEMVDRLTDAQAQTVLAMLARFFGHRKGVKP